MRSIYLACDLKNDPELIEKYKNFHLPGNVPEAVLDSIRDAGILNMEIFNTGNRLFMIMTVTDQFNAVRKVELDKRNPHVQDWERKMDEFQQYLPLAKGVKWVEMVRIFNLKEH